MKTWLSTVLVLILTAPASLAMEAALAWDTQLISVSAAPGQRVVHSSFGFRNASASPVAILSLETSCRCTSADSDKRTYAPGEKGKVEVTFAIGDQEGVQEKAVTVSTDEPGARPSILVLRVAIARGK